MKIAMVSEHASPLASLGGVDAGGQNVHVAALSAALARAGHDVTVYTRRDDTTTPQTVRHDGYLVRPVPVGPPRPVPKDELMPMMPEFGRWLEAEWRQDPPDVVHAHFWMSGLACFIAVQDLGIPVVQTFHALGVVKKRFQGDADTSPDGRIAMERSLARRCARVVATSTDEVFELLRMGVPRTRTTVVPCGVDLDLFTDAGSDVVARSSVPRGERFRLLSVGRLVPRKGVETIVRALAGLPDVELVVAGGPPPEGLDDDDEVTRLRAIADQLGVADRTTFLGCVDHDALPALYASADVVVCVPWYEPFGIVPLEAMACARPVIASAVGGLVDTVVDGVTGLLIRPKAPVELVRAVRAIQADSFTRQGMGQAAVERARMRYSWDRVAAETQRAYVSVLTSEIAQQASR